MLLGAGLFPCLRTISKMRVLFLFFSYDVPDVFLAAVRVDEGREDAALPPGPRQPRVRGRPPPAAGGVVERQVEYEVHQHDGHQPHHRDGHLGGRHDAYYGYVREVLHSTARRQVLMGPQFLLLRTLSLLLLSTNTFPH